MGNLDRVINPILSMSGPFNKKVHKTDDIERSVFEDLKNKDILKKDMMENHTLTSLGRLVVEKIDRNNIIDDLLN